MQVQPARNSPAITFPGLYHLFKTPISALVLIHTADLQVLIMERADKAGFWQSVTGSLEKGETPKQAAVREVLEETGLDANQYDLQDWQASNIYEIYPHWRHRYAPGVVENVEHLFGLELPQPLPITLAPDEHIRYEWVDWREAANRVFSWTNIDALKRLGERHNLVL
ncbi:MAG: dihydroneopterin triphosphate diphosphatase [Pseudomonadota bacterium]